MQLDLKEVNEILEYFENVEPYYLDKGQIDYKTGLKYELIEKVLVKDHMELSGYNGQTDYIFKINDSLYIKVSHISDSYGDFKSTSVRFVVPKEVTKTEFKNI